MVLSTDFTDETGPEPDPGTGWTYNEEEFFLFYSDRKRVLKPVSGSHHPMVLVLLYSVTQEVTRLFFKVPFFVLVLDRQQTFSDVPPRSRRTRKNSSFVSGVARLNVNFCSLNFILFFYSSASFLSFLFKRFEFSPRSSERTLKSFRRVGADVAARVVSVFKRNDVETRVGRRETVGRNGLPYIKEHYDYFKDQQNLNQKLFYCYR